MSDDWTPAFPGQRPPFRPGNKWRVGAGNQLARTHGAYSFRTVQPRAERIVRDLLAIPELGYLAAPMFHETLWKYARAQARADLAAEWAGKMPGYEAFVSPPGGRPAAEVHLGMEVTAQNLADKLGLSPVWAEFFADDIAAAWEQIGGKPDALG
ncbi:hypothetical protein [Pseudolysinimonas sp.]|uniref:hypothetical protein n=1 Tax=Pseudolysinimonas sp. TaxID=2680009 RepID=UPI003F80D1AB